MCLSIFYVFEIDRDPVVAVWTIMFMSHSQTMKHFVQCDAHSSTAGAQVQGAAEPTSLALVCPATFGIRLEDDTVPLAAGPPWGPFGVGDLPEFDAASMRNSSHGSLYQPTRVRVDALVEAIMHFLIGPNVAL